MVFLSQVLSSFHSFLIELPICQVYPISRAYDQFVLKIEGGRAGLGVSQEGDGRGGDQSVGEG